MIPQGGGLKTGEPNKSRRRSRSRDPSERRGGFSSWGAERVRNREGGGGHKGGHNGGGRDGRGCDRGGEVQQNNREGGASDQYQYQRRRDVDDLGREIVHHQPNIASRDVDDLGREIIHYYQHPPVAPTASSRPSEASNKSKTIEEKTSSHQVIATKTGPSSSSSIIPVKNQLDDAQVLKNEDKGEKMEKKKGEEEEEVVPEMDDDNDDDAIAAALGFSSFGSTKGAAVADNQMGPARGAAAKGVPKKVYRQYMHRITGFAHALDAQIPSKRKS
jgi:hypothetical protein